MRAFYFGILFLLFSVCSGKNNTTAETQNTQRRDTIIQRDTVFYSPANDWQVSFQLTHDPDLDSVWGKPVSFYINNSRCSPLAIDFYRSSFRPTDNNSTAALLELVTTDDKNLRPFYRWCLNKTIQIQDGALGEYTGVPARRYAEKFPEEFFAYMKADTSQQRYRDWVSSISYSGFYENEDYKNPKAIRTALAEKMKVNCKNYSAGLAGQIQKFTTDCFPGK